MSHVGTYRRLRRDHVNNAGNVEVIVSKQYGSLPIENRSPIEQAMIVAAERKLAQGVPGYSVKV